MSIFSQYSQEFSIAAVIVLVLVLLAAVVLFVKSIRKGKGLNGLLIAAIIVLAMILIGIAMLVILSGNQHPISSPMTVGQNKCTVLERGNP